MGTKADSMPLPGSSICIDISIVDRVPYGICALELVVWCGAKCNLMDKEMYRFDGRLEWRRWAMPPTLAAELASAFTPRRLASYPKMAVSGRQLVRLANRIGNSK